jgi:hypothetical protein
MAQGARGRWAAIGGGVANGPREVAGTNVRRPQRQGRRLPAGPGGSSPIERRGRQGLLLGLWRAEGSAAPANGRPTMESACGPDG